MRKRIVYGKGEKRKKHFSNTNTEIAESSDALKTLKLCLHLGFRNIKY
jgi:hypothetical protein